MGRTLSAWDRARHALAVCWVLLIGTAVAVGARSASLSHLQGDLTEGGVRTVRVAGGLEPGARGYATQYVRWRQGPFGYEAQVLEVSPGRDVPAHGSEISAVVRSDIGARLAGAHPGLRVVREEPARSGAGLLGWQVPVWVGLAGLALTLASLAVLIAGPQPWRATRWAWFWLLCSPLTSVVFLVLSGPTPLVPDPRNPARRLTGGWAFLLSLPLAALLRGPR